MGFGTVPRSSLPLPPPQGRNPCPSQFGEAVPCPLPPSISWDYSASHPPEGNVSGPFFLYTVPALSLTQQPAPPLCARAHTWATLAHLSALPNPPELLGPAPGSHPQRHSTPNPTSRSSLLSCHISLGTQHLPLISRLSEGRIVS